jgi:hypothetical protein
MQPGEWLPAVFEITLYAKVSGPRIAFVQQDAMIEVSIDILAEVKLKRSEIDTTEQTASVNATI